jgi:hypothetical protein
MTYHIPLTIAEIYSNETQVFNLISSTKQTIRESEQIQQNFPASVSVIPIRIIEQRRLGCPVTPQPASISST